MPPPLRPYIPHLANAYAKHIEPTAVINQDTIERAPTCANFVGNMIIPEPIIFTAVKIVSCNTDILFLPVLIVLPPFY